MTIGQYVLSLSSEVSGSALTVMTNVVGTYPVFTPFDSFEVTFDQPILDANLHVEILEANLNDNSLGGELISENLLSDLNSDILTGDLK
jgi:hypothetical protein